MSLNSKTKIAFDGEGKIEKYFGGQVVVIRTNEPTRSHVDAWFEQLEEIINAEVNNRPFGLLFNAAWGETTPYFRQRILQVNAMLQVMSASTRIAVVVDEEYKRELQVFANLTGSGSNHRLFVFHAYKDAFDWLSQII